ncbi:uncharacterized protein LOC118433003 [Folsomia candida]|uniref:uncharacterized protein LOC118433003 n=1 Tax=Folsomia candida TaxID=158441 RepID=UPI001604A89C|nr:uncharacterized protein LOC118433003 [Folsomia candida]
MSLGDDDPITNLISSVGATDNTVKDQLDDNVIETSMIEEILNASQVDEDYGALVEDKIAAAFKRVLTQAISKDQAEKIKNEFKIPDNVKEMKSPKVNPEIWSQLPKRAQASDNLCSTISQGDWLPRCLWLVCWRPTPIRLHQIY